MLKEEKAAERWKEIEVVRGMPVHIHRLSACAQAVMRKVNRHQGAELPSEPRKIGFARASVRELGFHEITEFARICMRVGALGGDFCPYWAAPQLRGKYPDQPAGEVLRLMTVPTLIPVRGMKHPFQAVLSLEHDEEKGVVIACREGAPETLLSLDNEVVFMIRG